MEDRKEIIEHLVKAAKAETLHQRLIQEKRPYDPYVGGTVLDSLAKRKFHHITWQNFVFLHWVYNRWTEEKITKAKLLLAYKPFIPKFSDQWNRVYDYKYDPKKGRLINLKERKRRNAWHQKKKI